MKIYIVNILPSSIDLDKLSGHKNMLVKVKNISEFISENMGVVIMDESDNTTYRLEPVFNTNYTVIKQYNINANNKSQTPIFFDLFLDNSVETKVPVLSQFPTEYIITREIQYEFRLEKSSLLTLIVSCIEDVVIDFYFVYKKENIAFDIKDINIQTELNKFISLIS